MPSPEIRLYLFL